MLCSTRRRISKPSCVNNSTYYIIYKHNGVYIDRVYICPTAKRMEPPRKRKIKFRYGLTNEFRASRVASTAHSSIPFPITCSREFCMLFHPFVTFSLSPAALSSQCLCDALRRGRRRIDRKKTHNNCFLVVDWAFDIYGSGTRKCAYS